MARICSMMAAAGLFMGSMAGCAEPGVEVDATAVRFARGTGYEIIETTWQWQNDQDSSPFWRSDIRNVQSYVLSECVEVDNPPFLEVDVPDDSACYWTSSCYSGSTTHCEERPVQKWRYEQRREESIMACRPPLEANMKEYKDDNQNVEDPTCRERQLVPNQRLEHALQFMIRVQAQNPEYEEDKDEPMFVQDNVAISEAEWRQLDETKQLVARVSSGRVISVEFAEAA